MDAETIRRDAPAVASVSYLIRQSGQAQYASQNWTTGIQGVTANYPPITNWQIAAGRGGKPLSSQIAERLGLDDISLQTSGVSSGGTNDVASQVVVFGKRISDRLSLGYEQGLSLASSAVRLEYALSRQVTLRAEAGQVSGIGIVYRRNFE